MTPRFRWTLFNDTLYPTGIEVNEPSGWADCELTLERDKDYYSLVELFEGQFIWFGEAKTKIDLIRNTQGPDAKAGIIIELTYDSSTYMPVFDGLLDLIQAENVSLGAQYYKLSVPIIRDDFWASFMNLKSTSINLNVHIGLDNSTHTLTPVVTNIPLSNQVVRGVYNSDQVPLISLPLTSTSTGIVTFMPNTVSESNIDQVFSVPSYAIDGGSSGNAPPILNARFKGVYTLNLRIEMSKLSGGVYTAFAAGAFWALVKNNDFLAPTFLTRTTAILAGRTSGIYTISTVLNLVPGDQITLFAGIPTGLFTAGDAIVFYGSGLLFLPPPSGAANPNTFSFTSDTEYKDSTVDTLLIKDALDSAATKIVNSIFSVVKSDYLDNCAGNNAVTKGINFRDFLFTDKPFFSSFDDLYNLINPLYCLGLGYTKVLGVPMLEIEKRADFFDPTPVVYINGVTNLKEAYDQDLYFKNINIKFAKAPDIGIVTDAPNSIDDPQTTRKYRSKFATIGKDITMDIKGIGAGLTIEQGRRQQLDKNQTWSFDEDTFIIATDPTRTRPEVGADFAAITNVLNAGTRYNLRHGCAHVMRRWLGWLEGCLQIGVNYFYFSGGSGNYTATTQFQPSDCEAISNPDQIISENADIPVDANFTLIPKMYTADSVPMTWVTYQAIEANRKKAIALSADGSTYYAYFIKVLKFKHMKGQASLLVHLANETPL